MENRVGSNSENRLRGALRSPKPGQKAFREEKNQSNLIFVSRINLRNHTNSLPNPIYLKLISVIFLSIASTTYCLAAQAQKIPDLTPAPKGQTINMSVSSGTKSSLSFGTNTSFGTSVSTQNSPGMTVTATSNLTPLVGSITSAVGSGLVAGKTTAEISNLRAAGSGPSTIGGSQIDMTEGNFATGNSVLDGLTTRLSLELNPEETGFSVEAMPNIVGGVACNSKSGVACSYTDTTGNKPYNYIDSKGNKPYDDIQITSGSANSNINSGTNVDIQNSQFSSAFMQSF